jgi:drug/metabolite transporter (DMT)-like permease
MTYFVALICVFGIALGQILFKLSALSLKRTGDLFQLETTLILVSALMLYGVTTIAWVWVLKNIDLGRAYPLMALAFVLVPLGSYFFLGERFTVQYFAGITLIILGIVITFKGCS